MSEIKPALTEKEWVELRLEIKHPHGVLALIPYIADMPPGGIMHKVGAACLHKQPFGFTREDVARHRDKAVGLQASLSLHRLGPVPGGNGVAVIEAERDWHESMADRIEALLPPEEK